MHQSLHNPPQCTQCFVAWWIKSMTLCPPHHKSFILLLSQQILIWMHRPFINWLLSFAGCRVGRAELYLILHLILNYSALDIDRATLKYTNNMLHWAAPAWRAGLCWVMVILLPGINWIKHCVKCVALLKRSLIFLVWLSSSDWLSGVYLLSDWKIDQSVTSLCWSWAHHSHAAFSHGPCVAGRSFLPHTCFNPKSHA